MKFYYTLGTGVEGAQFAGISINALRADHVTPIAIVSSPHDDAFEVE